MSQHTQGPWKRSGERWRIEGTWNGCPSLVAQVNLAATNEEREANARLIAAAPTMKEALEEVDVGLQFYMERHGEYDNRLSALRNIIADALAKAIAG